MDREMVFRAVGHPSPMAGLVEPAAAAVWLRCLAVPCAIAAAWTGYLAHRTLELNRTPGLRTKMGQRLVAEGVYTRARHPMYTSQLRCLSLVPAHGEQAHRCMGAGVVPSDHRTSRSRGTNDARTVW
jgi:protein-S-isoprenylcysteine O-methyltransferase Ste14